MDTTKENDWFHDEVMRIRRQDYVGTKFYVARLLNLDYNGEGLLHETVIVPVDEYFVEYRGMGFEVIRLESLVKRLPKGWSIDRCDIQLKTAHTKIDGQLDELIMESKELHDHLKEINS